MSNINNENRWISMTEICNYLGISRDTAIKWINKKICQHTKLGVYGNLKLTKLTNGFDLVVLKKSNIMAAGRRVLFGLCYSNY